MSETELQPAPDLSGHQFNSDKWQREFQEFLRLKPRLLEKYDGQYVAVHEGQVVDSGPDQVELAMRVYSKHGYCPIYVGLVTDQPEPMYRIPTPRRYPPRLQA
jgi:hypothetical protein